MKKIIALFLMLTSATLLFAKGENKKAAQSFDFESVDLDGNTISSEIYANNKITMINIWGTFCGPCIREMPDLAKLSEANINKGVEIVGIPIDVVNDWGKVDPAVKADALMIMKKTGAKYKNIIPTISMFQTMLRDVQVVPTTIFIDKNGNQIGNPYLGSRSQKDWQKIIDKLLESQK